VQVAFPDWEWFCFGKGEFWGFGTY
jgi:hypothetical protein